MGFSQSFAYFIKTAENCYFNSLQNFNPYDVFTQPQGGVRKMKTRKTKTEDPENEDQKRRPKI